MHLSNLVRTLNFAGTCRLPALRLRALPSAAGLRRVEGGPVGGSGRQPHSRTERLTAQVGESASAYPLPLTAGGVTAAWLSAALSTRGQGVVVGEVEPVQVIDGTATKVRLRLAYGPYTRRDGLPDQMCVKGGFGAYREYLGGMGLYSGEVRFFNEIAPLYELARPASYSRPHTDRSRPRCRRTGGPRGEGCRVRACDEAAERQARRRGP